MKAVLFATLKEATPLLEGLKPLRTLKRIGENNFLFGRTKERSSIFVSVVGMGKKAAQEGTATILRRYTPRTVINIGIAGALKPSITIGAIYRITATVDRKDAPPHPVYPCVYDPYFDLPAATLVTVSAPVFDARQKTVLSRQGELVDMEGAVIAAQCREWGIACSQIKGVSDTAAEGDRETLRNNLTRVSEKLARYIIPKL